MSGSKGRTTTDRRGQSSVIAVVLLVAIVSISATGVALVGSQSVSQTKDVVENERVKSGFQSLDKNLDTVARTEGGSRSVDLAIDGSRGAVRREDTGRIVVTTDNRTTPIVNRTLGSITYTTNDGQIYAYQAGGVFSGTGRQSQVVSNPDLHYRGETLTLPIVIVGGDERLTDNRVTITKNITPLRSDIKLLKNEFLTMTVTSEYYMGWAQYFQQQTNAVAVKIDHANETVKVDLGRAEADGSFDNGVTAIGSVAAGGGNADIDGPISATGSIDSGLLDGDDTSGVSGGPTPVDNVIERKIEWAENNSGSVTTVSEDLSGVSELQGGVTYYAPDGITLDDSSEDIVANLSSGNVTLIVDGDVHLTGGDITVENGAGVKALRTYADGDVAMKNSEWCVGSSCTSGTTKYNQIYGPSDMQVGITGGSTNFEGTIYAPRNNEVDGENTADSLVNSNNECDKPSGSDDYDVCLTTGDAGFRGSVIAGSTKVGQSTTLEYDSSLEDVNPVLSQGNVLLPPEITYLHITVYKVDVNSEN